MYSRAYVEITNICNMNCSFCHGHSRVLRRMSQEEFARILEQLKGQTNYIYYHLMGEPLTHPLLPEFIKMAGEQGFKSIITTNGTLLKKRAAELLEAGLHKVSISVHSFEDGTEEEQERYLTEIADFAAEASAAGVIVVFRLWNLGYDGGRNQQILEFLQNRLPGEWQENTRGIRIREKLHLEYGDRFEWPDAEAQNYGDSVFCYGMKEQFGILCDGTVVPCCLDSEGTIALGNVYQEDLVEILNSERAQKIRQGFDQRKAAEDLCRRCGYAQRFR